MNTPTSTTTPATSTMGTGRASVTDDGDGDSGTSDDDDSNDVDNGDDEDNIDDVGYTPMKDEGLASMEEVVCDMVLDCTVKQAFGWFWGADSTFWPDVLVSQVSVRRVSVKR